MPSVSKKQVGLAALAALVLLSLAAFVTIPPAIPEPIQLRILGRTNDPAGASMALVGVTNHTGQARIFYLSTFVPCPGGWTSANQRCQHVGRLAAHAECRVLLRAPAGAVRWKFSCMSMPDVSKPEWAWYRLVRRAGLGRVGLRGQPAASYVWTSELRL